MFNQEANGPQVDKRTDDKYNGAHHCIDAICTFVLHFCSALFCSVAGLNYNEETRR